MISWNGDKVFTRVGSRTAKNKKVVHVFFSNYSQVIGPPPPLNPLKRSKNKIIALLKITHLKREFRDIFLSSIDVHLLSTVTAICFISKYFARSKR